MRESNTHQQTMERINRFASREKVEIRLEGEVGCPPPRKAPVLALASIPPIRFSGTVPIVNSQDTGIKLGDTFRSFAEVSQAISMYEKRNKVRLTQKYFRRIAAFPKPSNKEDYMLTEEERKRFVYRWVDFCCTYFDDLLAHADDNDESGATQVLGLTMKECSMRIRFQLRCNEKDIMVSIFKEEHDHVHDHTPPISEFLKKINEVDIASNSTPNDLTSPKRPRKEPPSLAPISSLKHLASSIKAASSSNSDSPVNLRTHLNPSAPIPKPPPLKAMPLLACNTESPTTRPSNALSAENVIRNIYLYLCRMQATGFIPENGLRFATTNPDLIKITSELSGVDASRVSDICRAKNHPNAQKKAKNIEEIICLGSPAASKPSCSSTQPQNMSVKQNNNIIKRVNNNQSIANSAKCTETRNQQPQGDNNTAFIDIDALNNLVNLPVEIILNPESDMSFDYYDEND